MILAVIFLISIHALRVEGDGGRAGDKNTNKISIHALRVEGDAADAGAAQGACDFYPRPPGGGRHSYFGPIGVGVGISIHALRVEGDLGRTCHVSVAQSVISIHALRVEGDPEALNPTSFPSIYFYPRPPGGGRQYYEIF